MAKSNAERSAKAAEKRVEFDEKELRHRVRLGTQQKLDELMAWNGITEMSEAVQNLILNAHALGPTLSFQAMEVRATKYRLAKTWRECFEMRVWPN
ncbi:hypothetical protein [Pseudomonas protegens]|uniref:hypothetical protein n=1 Tax=Pseudomonas protegens TaxID=380021 RepID=UPI0026CB5E30|nr:hypothetical protein [Pseudomonas protegens]